MSHMGNSAKAGSIPLSDRAVFENYLVSCNELICFVETLHLHLMQR